MGMQMGEGLNNQENFRFELNMDEIATLSDFDRRGKAREIFYQTIEKLELAELEEVLPLVKAASKQIKDLYRDSEFYDRDFQRLDGQLYKAANQRANFLRGTWLPSK